jgi:hypothetical protein
MFIGRIVGSCRLDGIHPGILVLKGRLKREHGLSVSNERTKTSQTAGGFSKMRFCTVAETGNGSIMCLLPKAQRTWTGEVMAFRYKTNNYQDQYTKI